MIPLRILTLMTALSLALVVTACGSDGSPSGTSAASGPSSGKPPQKVRRGGGSKEARHVAKQAPPAPEPRFIPRAHHDSGGGSQQLMTKGGDNSIQEFGSEPSASEFEQAATVLHEYLDARAVGAWRVACDRLSPRVARELARQLGSEAGGSKAGCAQVLRGLTAGLPTSGVREAAIADVRALRAEGSGGYLLYRGADGQNYFIPMAREHDHWRVAAIAASPLF